MEKKNKKKDRKKRLLSLILLLFLSVILLGTSTYAWFTSNKSVKVDTLDVHVETQNGLQISTDATNWKTVINTTDITTGYSGAVNQLPANLEPVSTGKVVDTNTGYLNMYYGVVATNAGGEYILTSSKSTETNSSGVDSQGKFIAFDLFFKVEKDTPLYLTTSSSVIAKDGSADQGLKNATRVAFLVEGTSDLSATPATIQGLKGATDGTTYIWEPNYDVHTDAGVANARDVYGITTTKEGGNLLPYDGVISDITSDNDVLLSNAKAASFDTLFKSVTPSYKTDAAFGGSAQAYVPIFTVNAGVTKVRVYMWVEGQDVDCENNASGTDISFNLHFSANASA